MQSHSAHKWGRRRWPPPCSAPRRPLPPLPPLCLARRPARQAPRPPQSRHEALPRRAAVQGSWASPWVHQRAAARAAVLPSAATACPVARARAAAGRWLAQRSAGLHRGDHSRAAHGSARYQGMGQQLNRQQRLAGAASTARAAIRLRAAARLRCAAPARPRHLAWWWARARPAACCPWLPRHAAARTGCCERTGHPTEWRRQPAERGRRGGERLPQT